MGSAAQRDVDLRYRSLFEQHPDAVFELDCDGRFVTGNASLTQLLGYGVADLRESTYLPFVHADDADHVTAQFRRACQGEARTYHTRALHRDGHVRHVRVTNLLIVVDGEVVGVYGIAHDVTAERRAEDRARHGEAMLQLAGSIARFGGWAIDADTGELSWTHEINHILDYPPDVTPELDEAVALVPEPDRTRIAGALEACLANGTPFDLEMETDTAAGRRLTVREVGHAERAADGRITAVRGAFQDVTEQRRAAAELQETAAQLTQTLQIISDGVGMVDPDWTVTYVNAQGATILGREPEQLIGSNLLELYPELEATPVLAAYRRAMDEREPATLDPVHVDQLDRWFEITAYPAYPGIFIYFRDVTDARERERRLEEVARAEQMAADQLRRLDQVKNTFLTAVSHELRTPLTVVQGLAQTLQRAGGDLGAELRTQIEHAIGEHAARLTHLLDDLLDLDRLSRETLRSTPEEVEIVELTQRVIARSPLDGQVSLDAPERLPTHVDPVLFERMLDNLLDNAGKYGGDGTVEVRLTRLDGGGVRLETIDQGPGIPDDYLDAVFQPFHRADHELGPKPGTGIGLTLVAEFARLHGGRAWAEPSRAGAHLVVELPAVHGEEP